MSSNVQCLWWRYQYVLEKLFREIRISQLLFDQHIFMLNHFHLDNDNCLDNCKSAKMGKYLLVNLLEPIKKELSASNQDGTCVCDNTCGLYPECCCDWLVPKFSAFKIHNYKWIYNVTFQIKVVNRTMIKLHQLIILHISI